MKKVNIIIAFIVLFAVSAPTWVQVLADDPIAAIISADDAKVGDTLTVTVSLGENEGIASGSFNVLFDSQKLKLIEAASDTEMMSGVMYALNDHLAENAVRISFASSSVFGAHGGDLMRLQFEAIGDGNAELAVEKLKLGSETTKYTTADTKITIVITAAEIVGSASEEYSGSTTVIASASYAEETTATESYAVTSSETTQTQETIDTTAGDITEAAIGSETENTLSQGDAAASESENASSELAESTQPEVSVAPAVPDAAAFENTTSAADAAVSTDASDSQTKNGNNKTVELIIIISSVVICIAASAYLVIRRKKRITTVGKNKE